MLCIDFENKLISSYEYAVVKNKDYNVLQCYVHNDFVTGGQKVYLKVKANNGTYFDKIDVTSLVEEVEDGLLCFEYQMSGSVCANKELFLQVQQELDGTISQSQIVRLVLANTIDIEGEIDNHYPQFLSDLERELADLEIAVNERIRYSEIKTSLNGSGVVLGSALADIFVNTVENQTINGNKVFNAGAYFQDTSHPYLIMKSGEPTGYEGNALFFVPPTIGGRLLIVNFGTLGYVPSLQLIRQTTTITSLVDAKNFVNSVPAYLSSAQITDISTLIRELTRANATFVNETGESSCELFVPYDGAMVSLGISLKQPMLVSGTNIKTINGQSILGEGNIVIEGTDYLNWGHLIGDINDQLDLQTALNGKQDKLIAGVNITIENNVISATSVGGAWGDITGNIQNQTDLMEKFESIEGLIPAQATTQNQLADKDFVNSSIATNTATFRGTYNVVTDLGLTIEATHQEIANAIATKLASLSIVADDNDYVFVSFPNATVSTDFDKYERYKFNGTSWAFEFVLNNSSFTAQQWASINSGITASMVADLPLKSADNTWSGQNTFTTAVTLKNNVGIKYGNSYSNGFTICNDGSGGLLFKNNYNVSKYHFTDSYFYPDVSGVNSLGTLAKCWDNTYTNRISDDVATRTPKGLAGATSTPTVENNSVELPYDTIAVLLLDDDTTITLPTTTGCLPEYKANITNSGASPIIITFPSGTIIETNDTNITISNNTMTLPTSTSVELNLQNGHAIVFNWDI